MKKIILFACLFATPVVAQTVGTYQEDNGATKNNIGIVIKGNTSTDTVQGTTANGGVASTNPVLVAGSDGTNIRSLKTDTAGILNVTVPAGISGNTNSGTTDSGPPVKVGGYASSATPTAVTAGQRVNAWYNLNGAQVVSLGTRLSGNNIDGESNATITIPSGSEGASGSLQVATKIFNGTGWDRATAPNLVSRVVSSAATTNATNVKASPGKVHEISAYNTTATIRYLKLYNKATPPTAGADTPFVTLVLPPNSQLVISYPNGGLYFTTGIGFAITTLAADSDTTAIGAGDIVALNIVNS
jgi:hypothetical protein